LAFTNNVLIVAIDTGHSFAYLRESGTVTSILSFGPGAEITGDNVGAFLSGTLPGDAHWRLHGSVNTWEFPITSQQMSAGKQAIDRFKSHVPNYTVQMQCTSAALFIAAAAGVSLPTGAGTVIYRNSNGPTLYTGVMANPYQLNQQMTGTYGAPHVVSYSTFPSP
jgi:hypothetical protein